MAAWISLRFWWRGLTRSRTLLTLALLVQGCQSKAPAPRPAFADLEALVRLHPANPALRELEAQIRLARPTQVRPQPPVLTPPAGPPPPRVSALPEPAARAGIERLRQELAEDLDRRIALKRKELDRASQAAIGREEIRVANLRLAERTRILETRKPRISHLESSVALLTQRLRSPSLALGERGQIENRISELGRELDTLRSDEEKDLATADSRYRQQMDVYREDRTRLDAAELSRARATLEEEFARSIAQQRARVKSALTPPQMPAPSVAPPKPVEAPVAAAPFQQPGAKDHEMLLAEFGRLKQSMRRQTAATAVSLASQHHIRLLLNRDRKQSLPDVTAQVASWLKRHWSAHPPEKEATQP